MRSSLPKVLHDVCGRPMVAWPIAAARAAGAARVCVIVSPERDLSPALPNGTETVVQPDSDGTGGALRAAREVVAASETVLVLSGDHPLISAEVLGGLLDAHREAGAAATVLTTELDDPESYGRVVRGADRAFERIVEAKAEGDASAAELEIKEVNAGTYAFAAGPLEQALGELSNDNAQGEYYLPDVLPLIKGDGAVVLAHKVTDDSVTLGVNDRVQLAKVTEKARQTIIEEHMRSGVTIVDPAATWIDAEVELAPDVRIEPGTTLRGATSVGAGSVIGPHTTVVDSKIGERVTAPHSYLTECDVADEATIGPFAYLRPGARIGEGAKAGTFVEIKNSEIGKGAKVPHLSYIGDADVGERTNLGASTVTANYDGFRKNRTKIGSDVHGGVDTTFVAPVEVGDGAYTGAGSVITDDVPDGALGIARQTQENVEGFAERKAKEPKEKDS
jgi:bifunctional UDP-N-acetylglucosamine pyrophosphorylase/glucosamine-1-phosphate N-acetyltransferase